MKRSELCRGVVGRILGLKEWIGLAIILLAAVVGAHAAFRRIKARVGQY